MADVVGIDRRFDVVRRGYDIDQVDAFVAEQAAAWRSALDMAKAQVASLEAELVPLRLSEAERASSEEELASTRRELRHQREQLRADGERQRSELEQLRKAAEAEAAATLELAEQEAADRMTAGRVEGERLLEQADRDQQERLQLLGSEFETTKERYGRAEQVLRSKLDDLAAARDAVIFGLETIASGGLRDAATVEELLHPGGSAAADLDPEESTTDPH